MRFGWLTLAHSPSAEEDHAAIGEQLEQAGLAETVGFDSVWLTEHNFTGEAVYCDPIPFASALAARTSRVRIGFAVIQLALRHPVRLAVQLALLDNLSHGRLDVGVGRGSLYNEYEFVGYGLRSDDSRERSTEALEILTRAWTEAPFAYQGKFFQVSLPALRPRVYQRPHPPIWRSVVTAASFAECGRLGAPILTSRIPLESIGARLRLYEDGLIAGGHPEPPWQVGLPQRHGHREGRDEDEPGRRQARRREPAPPVPEEPDQEGRREQHGDGHVPPAPPPVRDRAADQRPDLHPADGEVARVLDVRLEALLASGSVTWSTRIRGDDLIAIPAFSVSGVEIWGATAMVLGELLALLGWKAPAPPARAVR